MPRCTAIFLLAAELSGGRSAKPAAGEANELGGTPCRASGKNDPPGPHANTPSGAAAARGVCVASFRSHPVSSFLLPLLKNQDHEQFEIICYSDVVSPDSTTCCAASPTPGIRLRGFPMRRSPSWSARIPTFWWTWRVTPQKTVCAWCLCAPASGADRVTWDIPARPGCGRSLPDHRCRADPPGMTEAFYTTLWRLPRELALVLKPPTMQRGFAIHGNRRKTQLFLARSIILQRCRRRQASYGHGSCMRSPVRIWCSNRRDWEMRPVTFKSAPIYRPAASIWSASCWTASRRADRT